MSYVTASLCLLAAASLLRRRGELAGTTAIAPLWWSVVALVAVGGCEAMVEIVGVSENRAGHLRYLASVATFCPLMAVLGAKRPQDRGWQFIVVSLWLVLSLPGWQALLYWPESPLQVHGVWRWLFLWPLLLIGLANNLPTRYMPPALAAFLGQLLLLQPQLFTAEWLDDTLTSEQRVLFGGFWLALAAMLWALRWPRPTLPSPSIDRAFIEFRDLFGAVWGLRIAARFNAAAVMYDWGVWLTWRGLVETSDSADEATSTSDAVQQAQMQQNLIQLLRRFVSNEWLAQRLGTSPDLAGISDD